MGPRQKERVNVGYKNASVWHCSLSLRKEEGALSDQHWGDIANDFMDSMGFTAASGKAQFRWAAVNHGTSENGNHHIHIAVSLIRGDGTKASTHGHYKRAQQTCRELEFKYGLKQLSTAHATCGYNQAEKVTAVRDEREMHRSSLAQNVRASASASATEAEFVDVHVTSDCCSGRATRRTPQTSSLPTPSRSDPSRGSGLFGSWGYARVRPEAWCVA